METISFLCLFTLSMFGCNKPEQISPEREQLLNQYKEVDIKMMWYLGVLAGPSTSLEERKKVICEDFPITYEQEYLPFYLKLSDPSDADTSPNILKSIDSYKTRYNIQC